MAMHMRGTLVLIVVMGLVLAAVEARDAVHVLATCRAPVVTGHIVSRDLVPRDPPREVDFTIRIEDSDVEVHARAGRYLMATVPETVRFHYTGDPAREVFLFEHEENPVWIAAFGCGISFLFSIPLLDAWRSSRRARRRLLVGGGAVPVAPDGVAVYRVPAGWRIVVYVLAAALAGAGGWVITFPFLNGRTSHHALVTVCVLAGTGVLALGFCLFWSIIRERFEVQPDKIRYVGFAKPREFAIADVRGFRIVRAGELPQLMIFPSDPKAKRLKPVNVGPAAAFEGLAW